MRKEVILAVVIGIFLGGIILYGINLANSSTKINLQSQTTTDEAEPTPSKLKTEKEIVFIFPQNNSVVTDAQITLKGSTAPHLSIAIISENDDIITTSDNLGNFSSVINLSSGENLITVMTVNENQATASSTITVIRTTSLPN